MIFFQALGVLAILELIVFILVGSEIGVLQTLLLCVLSGAAGILVIQHQGMTKFGQMRTALEQGLLPMDEMFDALCLMIAGALLMLPGFLSDILAFILLFPFLRQWIRTFFAKRYGGNTEGTLNPDTGIIEGDYIRIRDVEVLPPRNTP